MAEGVYKLSTALMVEIERRKDEISVGWQEY